MDRLTDVTGVSDLRIAYDGTIYVYDVSFVTEKLTAKRIPHRRRLLRVTFRAPNLQQPSLLIYLRLQALRALQVLIRAQSRQAAHFNWIYSHRTTRVLLRGFTRPRKPIPLSNRSPGWIPVGPGCCAGGFDSTGSLCGVPKGLGDICTGAWDAGPARSGSHGIGSYEEAGFWRLDLPRTPLLSKT